MPTAASILRPLDITPGVQPITDSTSVSTVHYTYSDKIRFKNLFPEKIGGWVGTTFDYGATIDGTVRTIFTENINGKFYTILGTDQKLYSLIGSRLTNITPLDTDTIAIANSLDTQYGLLGNNPFSTTLNSTTITVTDPDASRFQAGDTVKFSGAAGFAGILAAEFNAEQIVRSVGVGSYTIIVSTPANAATSGGGALVNRSSGLIKVTDAAHDQSDGDRVKITGATNTGGILAADINKEFIIRNVSINTFDIMTDGIATSSVTAGGGGATEYSQEIPPGALNESNIQGYGAGLYGVGLYGTALVSSTGRSYPRIWICDRYANTIVMTPGNQTGVYQWFGDNAEAPVLVANAPDEINYLFVSDNILVTLGADDVENRIFASDQNNITQWTSSSTIQVFDDDVEGAGRLISHLPVEDNNLLFTENQTYTFRYIGQPLVWEIKQVDEAIGLIAPMARVSAKGIGFWMGAENFYMYRGGKAEIIPANTQKESTCINYVFENLNWGQKSKFFAWYNREFNEVWFHYASAGSNECDRVVVVDLADLTWAPHILSRTAASYPAVKLKKPYLANVGSLYQHEVGTDADTDTLNFTLVGHRLYYEKDNINLNRIVPDSILTGTMYLTHNLYLWPQAVTPTYTLANPVTQTTEYIPIVASGRFHEFMWTGGELGQTWTMGAWMEEIQKGSPE